MLTIYQAKKISKSKDTRPKASNDFHFIHIDGDNSSISDETRITIRKRVMADYMHRKRRRATESQQNFLKLVREIGQVDPFDAFPIKFEPYMFDLLKYCNPPSPSEDAELKVADTSA